MTKKLVISKFNIFRWVGLVTLSSFALGLILVLIEKPNLGPIPILFISFYGLIVGTVTGAILWFFKVSKRTSWKFYFGMLFATLISTVYIRYFHTTKFGRIVEGKYISCEKSDLKFTHFKNGGRVGKKLNAIKIEFNILRERAVRKKNNGKYFYLDWEKANRLELFHKQQTQCPKTLPLEDVTFRVLKGWVFPSPKL